jgi:hypothetical protein
VGVFACVCAPLLNVQGFVTSTHLLGLMLPRQTNCVPHAACFLLLASSSENAVEPSLFVHLNHGCADSCSTPARA